MDQPITPQDILDALRPEEIERLADRVRLHRAHAEIAALRQRLAEREQSAESAARPENVVSLPPTGAAD